MDISFAPRIVVVGYGMGAVHARFISEVWGLRLFGICDLLPAQRAQAAADHPKSRIYERYEDVLDDADVQCVILVTPHNTHATMAIQAMNRGKHVVTDKPMALSLADARAMIAARDENRVLLSTFQNRRFDGDFLTIKQALRDNVLGEIYHIESNISDWGAVDGWRADRACMGGWLFDWGAHTIDQILQLVEAPPKHVYAFAHHRYDQPCSVEDYVNCTVTFHNGVTATTCVGYLNKTPMPRWYIMGRKGTLRMDWPDKPAWIRTEDEKGEAEFTIGPDYGDWKWFYMNLDEALNGRGALAVQPEQLLPQIAIAEAAYKSIETEQVVPVRLAKSGK